ncbi:recombinase family protein [uncultured Aquimarina sp.]|uniref:recombinase family protein n=1 Tax=uncultured Aquimarina sp. TaxID=575652 RepID=UPI002617DF59|nr:recombinase family protein [uncultured Aquimarina sp.]
MSNKKNEEFEEIQHYVGETNKVIKQNDSKNIIAYCRVSDKKQIENDSTEMQLNNAKRFGINNEFKIVKDFEVLGESSKRGATRPSVDEMLEYIDKTEHKIYAIVVFHSNRFTRDGIFGAQFLDEIIARGVGFIDLNNPNDIFTETGRLRQIEAFYDAEEDNVTRKKFINATILEKLRQGYTMRKPPRGYKLINNGRGRNKEQKIIITEEGKLLKEAFKLKLEYNYSNVAIAEIMKSRGLDIHYKALGRAFKNPYYFGYIKDKRLIESNGVAKGRHPKLITWKEHKIINDIGGARKKQIKRNEIDQLPLRRHLLCSKCNRKLTGYPASKRKELFYYKCRSKGCNVNIKNEIVHKSYNELLDTLSFNKSYIPQLKNTLDEVFKAVNKSNTLLKRSITTSINKTEKERFSAIKNMNSYPEDKSLYKELIVDCDDKLTDLKEQLGDVRVGIDEIKNNTLKALNLISDLSSIWSSCDYKFKVKLQQLVFPDGIWYDKESNTLKAPKINPIFSLIKVFKEKLILEDTNKSNQNFDEKVDGVRTSDILKNMLINPNEIWGYEFYGEVENKEKIPLVVLLSDRSNNFEHNLFDSMDELTRFTELYRIINNNI